MLDCLCFCSPLPSTVRRVQAIKDGVIDAYLDHARGALVSKETTDVYSTSEPQQAFHKRISFCLDVHNEAVKVSTGTAVLLCVLPARVVACWGVFTRS